MTLDDIDVNYFVQVHEEIGTIGPSDVAVSCPMCREGKSWGRKHRLHLYTKPSYDTAAVACFNCNYSSNMYGYLKEFHPSEFSSYKKAKAGQGFAELRQLHEEKDANKKDELNFDNVDIGMDMTIVSEPIEAPEANVNLEEFADGETPVDMSTISGMNFGFDMSSNSTPEIPKVKKELDNQPKKDNPDGPFLIEPVKNLIPIPDDAKAYINKRGLEVQESWLYSPKDNKIRFNNTDVFLSEFIIVPLTIGNKWYGFQALAWKQKKFFVYLVTGNTSWKVENWDNINKDEPVYIFESIYDRLSSGLENSVAVLGSNLHDDRIKELKQPIFCLDNQNVDEKSVEESMKYLQAGYKCFLWPIGSDKFKDTNDLRKLKVPYDKIANMINTNIEHGMSGILKLKMKY